jgi:CheY-like chemotaxis protein
VSNSCVINQEKILLIHSFKAIACLSKLEYACIGAGLLKTVAVLDDDQALIELYQTVLEEEGYTVFPVPISKHLSQILARIGAVNPDILILDIHIPGLNSFEVIKSIQTSPELAQIRVLVCSASRPSLNALQGMLTREGLATPQVMEKPFDLDVLSQTISALAVKE